MDVRVAHRKVIAASLEIDDFRQESTETLRKCFCFHLCGGQASNSREPGNFLFPQRDVLIKTLC